jgi:endonuclease/exonuclease/phosphatase family metal-dependent hydrolase
MIHRRVILVILVACTIVFQANELFAKDVIVDHHAVIREGPSGTTRSLGTAEAGDKFELLEPSPSNNWYKIKFQGQEAWISAKWVELEGASSSESIKIASFNAKRLGHGQKDYVLTAQILSGYDLVALEEVMNKEGLKNLVGELKKIKVDDTQTDWRYIISEPVGRESYKECYAYIWKTAKTSLNPNSYYIFPDPEDHFIREPFIASFKSDKFDFTLIAAHFIFGDSKAARRAEAEAMADVFREVQDKDTHENDVILMGDFNLPPTDQGWSDMKQIANITWLIRPPDKTTIGDTKMVSLYDNFWFQTNYVTEFTGHSGVYLFMNDIYDDENRFKEAKDSISDHVPVWGEFSTEKDDD